MVAVQQNGSALQYASEELRGDPGLVMVAVQQNGMALKYASKELKNDLAIVLAAVEEDYEALKYASEKLRANRDFVLEAVKKNGFVLNLLRYEFKDDPIIVQEAVKQHGWALIFASAKLGKDPTIVQEAVKQNGKALQFVKDYDYLVDKETYKNIVQEAVKQNGNALQYVSSNLALSSPETYKNIVQEAVKQYPFAILHQENEAIGFEKEEDRSIHLKAFQRQAEILAQEPKETYRYRELYNEHVKHFQQLWSNNVDCISLMHRESKKDPIVIKAILSKPNLPEDVLLESLLYCFQKSPDIEMQELENLVLKRELELVSEKISQSDLSPYCRYSLLIHLQRVADQLYDLPPEQGEKWNRFIYSLKAQGLVIDCELQDLLFPTRNNPSQSASSGGASSSEPTLIEPKPPYKYSNQDNFLNAVLEHPEYVKYIPDYVKKENVKHYKEMITSAVRKNSDVLEYIKEDLSKSDVNFLAKLQRIVREKYNPGSSSGTRGGGYPSSPPGVFIGRATREGGYPSFAPQSRVTRAAARGVGDAARGVGDASSSRGRY